MKNELITVEQLPVITERLKEFSAEIDRDVKAALAMEVNEETKVEVKNTRADLTKKFNELEGRRKAVKTAVMAPYEAFEAVYRELVSDKFKGADKALKERIDTVEGKLKAEKQAAVEEYFNEYAAAAGIDFVKFEQAGVNVTLSASEKSLKEQAAGFIDRVTADVAIIENQERRDEVMAEYRKTLNCSQAVTSVADRHKALLEEETRRGERKAREEAEKQVVEKVAEIVPLAPPAEPPKLITAKFTVTATRERLISLRAFLDENNYTYE